MKFHWGSQPDQTWSATAYLDMIDSGLFGMHLGTNGLAIAPTLPAGWGDVTLSGVHYRGANLTIALHGAGATISSFTVDGQAEPDHTVPISLVGNHTVAITLSGAVNGDRDSDGVPDSQDLCPDQSGPAALHGCPAPTHIESEDALNTGGVKTTDNHANYGGRAFIDGLWSQGASSSYTVHRTTAQAGTESITFRYANANGDARTMTLSVNGTSVGQVTFPVVSSSWDDLGDGDGHGCAGHRHRSGRDHLLPVR